MTVRIPFGLPASRGLSAASPRPAYSPLPYDVAQAVRGATKVRKVQVLGASKARILWDLSRFDVNSRSLFPDLDGLASFLSWSYAASDPVGEHPERSATQQGTSVDGHLALGAPPGRD